MDEDNRRELVRQRNRAIRMTEVRFGDVREMLLASQRSGPDSAESGSAGHAHDHAAERGGQGTDGDGTEGDAADAAGDDRDESDVLMGGTTGETGDVTDEQLMGSTVGEAGDVTDVTDESDVLMGGTAGEAGDVPDESNGVTASSMAGEPAGGAANHGAVNHRVMTLGQVGTGLSANHRVVMRPVVAGPRPLLIPDGTAIMAPRNIRILFMVRVFLQQLRDTSVTAEKKLLHLFCFSIVGSTWTWLAAVGPWAARWAVVTAK